MTYTVVPKWLLNIPLDSVYEAAKAANISWQVLASVVMTESAGNQYASRYEPHYKWTFEVAQMALHHGITYPTELTHQMTSVGYCQLMFAVMREMGFKGSFAESFDRETNLLYGAEKLKQLLTKWPEMEAIAAYNAGSPRFKPDKVTFVNQRYVDKVYGYLRTIR